MLANIAILALAASISSAAPILGLESLPVVGGIVSNVGTTVQPVVGTVVGTVESLPVVGGVVSTVEGTVSTLPVVGGLLDGLLGKREPLLDSLNLGGLLGGLTGGATGGLVPDLSSIPVVGGLLGGLTGSVTGGALPDLSGLTGTLGGLPVVGGLLNGVIPLVQTLIAQLTAPLQGLIGSAGAVGIDSAIAKICALDPTASVCTTLVGSVQQLVAVPTAGSASTLLSQLCSSAQLPVCPAQLPALTGLTCTVTGLLGSLTGKTVTCVSKLL